MKYLGLSLRYAPNLRHPMHAYLDEDPAAVRSRLLTWNNVADESTYALFHVVADREPYVDRLEDVGAVDWFDVTPLDDGSFHVYVREPQDEQFRRFRAAFQQPTLLVVPPLEYRPRGVLAFDVIGDPDALQSVIEELPDGISADVQQVGEYDARPGRTGLTARQREALRAANAVGYYDVPRTGAVEDVADRLDVAPSTASNHLRKAEARLVDRVVGE